MSDSDLLSIFWVEASEYLQSLNSALLQMETADGQDQTELLREMNRVAHSLKGAARAVGYGVIEAIAHHMEEVFGAMQAGRLELTPEVADSLYDGLDLIQNVMDGAENDPAVLETVLANLGQATVGLPEEGYPIIDDDELLELEGDPEDEDSGRVRPFDRRATGDSREMPAVPPGEATPPFTTPQPMVSVSDSAPTMVLRPAEETIRVTVSKLDRLMDEASELLVSKLQSEERQRYVLRLRRLQSRWQREWRTVRAAYIRLVRRLGEQPAEQAAEMAQLFKFLESNQRYLTELGRELGILSQSITQDSMHLGTLSDQLQGDISAMRMLPFEVLIGGFQRSVRDLSRDLGKQVHLSIHGATVEFDKTVLDALNDPLLHLLRNAIDHGLEGPEERVAAGKPPVGRVEISVEQRGSEIVIRLRDDGRGLNIDRIKKRAVERRLFTEAEIATMTEDEVRGLIFHSGFSTSEQVTAVSGRGLGMDIVRTRVESLRGRVGIQSTPGQGTTMTLSVPVSLTRIHCILMRAGQEQYAIPSVMITRMEKIDRSRVFTAEGKDMVTINERPMPLVVLSDILEAPGSGERPEEDVQIVALEAADRAVALEVDELYSEMELVLKPLGPELANASYVAGAALLGSGQVVIVLDGNDLARQASGVRMPRRRLVPGQMRSTAPVRRLRVLVADDSITTRTLEKNILETAGFEVHVAIDGVEAWERLNEMDFDVVISDVEMPNMNGLELVERIKSHAHTRHLPVILLTSLSKPEQREAGLRAGADAYLVKSQFDQSELLETIQAII